MFYFVKTPRIVKKMYSFGVWDISTQAPVVYLSFDDGPHPFVTPFVLDQLKQYQAKATFFCIGKNVVENPAVYNDILAGGHHVGNHTHRHLNGWKVSDEMYMDSIEEASHYIESTLFRPPYGRIRKSQVNLLRKNFPTNKIIMWDVLSADFDININDEKCTRNVLRHTKPGSIIVFHDSEKAFPRLEKTLPVVLKELSGRGFVFNAIPY